MKKYYAFLVAGLLAIAFAAPAQAEEVVMMGEEEIVTIEEGDLEEVEDIEEVEEVEEEPEMWPVYVSLGALGITLILIILINLTHRRKK